MVTGVSFNIVIQNNRASTFNDDQTIPNNHRVHNIGNNGPDDNILVGTERSDDGGDGLVNTEVLCHNF